MTTPTTDLAVRPTDPMAMIALAIEKGLDAEQLNRLMDLKDRHEASEARKAFAQAMQQCQVEMPRIARNATNAHTKSGYANLEAVTTAITPVYTKAGLTLSYGTGEPRKPDDIRITCRVRHVAGHSEDFYFDLPADGVGAKGGAASMNAVQGRGSTISYGRRYLALMIFNLTVGDDTDGNGPESEDTLLAAEVEELRRLVRAKGREDAEILRFFKVEAYDQILRRDFQSAKWAIEKLSKKG